MVTQREQQGRNCLSMVFGGPPRMQPLDSQRMYSAPRPFVASPNNRTTMAAACGAGAGPHAPIHDPAPRVDLRESPMSLRSVLVSLILSLTAAVAHSAEPAAPQPAAAAPRHVSSGPFTQKSTGEGQLASAPYTMQITGPGLVYAAYITGRAHCSEVRAQLQVDDAAPVISDRLGPGVSSGYRLLGKIGPGLHTLAVRAEGVKSGCNTGQLREWSGSFEAVLLPPAPLPDSPWLIESFYSNFAWGPRQTGCLLSADGSVAHFGRPQSPPGFSPTFDALKHTQTYPREALETRYAPDYAATGTLPAEDLKKLALAPGLLAAAAKGTLSQKPAANDAGERIVTAWLKTGPASYQAITLVGRGDITLDNSAPEAAILLDILRSVSAKGCEMPSQR